MIEYSAPIACKRLLIEIVRLMDCARAQEDNPEITKRQQENGENGHHPVELPPVARHDDQHAGDKTQERRENQALQRRAGLRTKDRTKREPGKEQQDWQAGPQQKPRQTMAQCEDTEDQRDHQTGQLIGGGARGTGGAARFSKGATEIQM